MRQVRELWTPTTRLFDRADEGQPRKFLLDCGVAWQNYLDEAGVWQEIDLTPEPVAGGVRVRRVPYDLTILQTGERTVIPDRNVPSKSVRFPANRFLANRVFTRVGNSYVWSSGAFDIILRWENSRVKFDIKVKQTIPFDQVQFDVDGTGLSDADFLGFLSNLRAVDSSPPPSIVRPLSVSLSQGVLTLGFDLTGMTLPVTIDPTLDLQVGAGADDGYHYTFGHTVTITDTALYVGDISAGTANDGYGMWSRFTGVTVAKADTIDVAYLTLTPQATLSTASVFGRLNAEAADNPAAPTNDATYHNARTAARVDWDNIPTWTIDVAINTPSIVTVVQELVNRAGWASGNAQNHFLQDDDQRTTLEVRYRQAYSYESNTTKAPKLHIEYTSAAVDVYSGRGVGRGIGRGIMR